MNTQFKKLLSCILCVIIGFSVFITIPHVSAIDTSGIEKRLAEISSVYPSGSYFTVDGNIWTSNSGSGCQLSNIPSRGGLSSGREAANIFGESWSCNGFAKYVFYNIFHNNTKIDKLSSTVSINNAVIGDYVILDNHFGIFLYCDSQYVYLYDSNATSSPSNKVNWGSKFARSRVETIYHFNNYSSVNSEYSYSEPTVAELSTNKWSYKVNESVYFNINANGTVNNLWIYCPNGETLTYTDVGSSYDLAFGMSGYYEALVQTWNGVGNKTSSRISFYIGEPQKSILRINKRDYLVDERVYFTMDTDGSVNDLWIYCPNGQTLTYTDVGNSYDLGFGMAGYYEALVQTWNGVGSKVSERISFNILKNPNNNILTLNYNTNGGTISSKTYKDVNGYVYLIEDNSLLKEEWRYNTVLIGSFYNASTFGLKRTGYTFKGWMTSPNSSVIYDEEDESLMPQTVNPNLVNGSCTSTMYAAWEANKYKVTFNANSGSCSTTDKTVTYDSTYGTLPTPTRTGYTFDGWYTSATGGSKVTADTKVTITANQTLYAHWTQNHTHSYTSTVTKVATCKETGIKTFTCSCGNSYTETIPLKNHTDSNNDGYCDNCKAELTPHTPTKPTDPTPETKPCTCKCHSSGFSLFIWKIGNFFHRIFGMSKYRECPCGNKMHW